VKTLALVMLDRRLVVLKYMGKTPFLASCEKCHLKFFTPQELGRQPLETQENLQERFDNHKCRLTEVATRENWLGVASCPIDRFPQLSPQASTTPVRSGAADGLDFHMTCVPNRMKVLAELHSL
jgi:hypothetical protein